MANVSIPLKLAPQMMEDLKAEIHQAAFRGLVMAGMRGFQILMTRIIPRRLPPPIDRGTYRAGWKYRVDSISFEIYNDEPHAVFIEEGVRGKNVKPGRAMIEALAAWAQRKGLASNPKEAHQVAFAIAMSMRKAGIFNNGPFKNGLGILRELVDHYLDDLVEAEILANLSKI
jgi:hypothetical protein